MSLLNLRANFNTASNQESKIQMIEKFEAKNPGQFFYAFCVTDEFKRIQQILELSDEEIRLNLLQDMIIADVVTVESQNLIIGGLFFGDKGRVSASESSILKKHGLSSGKLFKCDHLELREEVIEKTILAAL